MAYEMKLITEMFNIKRFNEQNNDNNKEDHKLTHTIITDSDADANKCRQTAGQQSIISRQLVANSESVSPTRELSTTTTASINSIKSVEQYVERVVTDGKRYYLCKTCRYASNKCGNMVKHVRIHTGDKPFGCEFCAKQFSDPSTLRKHRLRHIEKKRQQFVYTNHSTRNNITVIKPIIVGQKCQQEANFNNNIQQIMIP